MNIELKAKITITPLERQAIDQVLELLQEICSTFPNCENCPYIEMGCPRANLLEAVTIMEVEK